MSSRLVRSPGGRAVAVEITTPVPCFEVGFRFRVLGDELRRPDGFGFTGEPTGRAPLPEETVVPRAGTHALERRHWSDADREQARRLQAEGLSWAAIAEQVCGDKRYKATVGGWLRTG